MKRILLTSTAIVALAGAAAAEVDVSADATVGYNDEFEGGAFVDSNVDLSASQELDNGITAGVTFGFTLADLGEGGTEGNFSADNNILVTLESDAGRMMYGDVNSSPQDDYFVGVTNDGSVVGFSDYDVDMPSLRGDVYMGDLSLGVSTLFNDDTDATNADDDDTTSLGVGAMYEGSSFSFGLGYEENEVGSTTESIMGAGASFTFSGVDLAANYIDGEAGSSIGVEGTVPVGPLSLTAFYVLNDDEADVMDDNLGVAVAYEGGPIGLNAWFHQGHDAEIGVEGSYAVGGGVTLYAGYIQGDDDSSDINSSSDSEVSELYVAGEYDMGGGATAMVSYGQVGDSYGGDLDEIGDDYEVKEGTTVQVSMSF